MLLEIMGKNIFLGQDCEEICAAGLELLKEWAP